VSPSLSIVIVTWNEREVIARCLPALVQQLQPGDELIVSDNGSTDGTLDVVRELAPQAIVVANGENLGFVGGCDSGAAQATGDVLVLLNPDTIVAPGWADAMRRPAEDGRGWAAWQALVTQDGGTRINTSGGVVHFTGVSWTGALGEPLVAGGVERGEVGFASGASLAVPLATWRHVGGMPAYYFLYHEDVELALRLRLEGGRIGIEPDAVVEHIHRRRGINWRMIERNRWATVIRTYPGSLLALVMPAMAAAEVGILAAATADGAGGQKLLAMADTARALPRLLRERRAIQARRTVSAAEFARHLTPDLSSPYLGAAGRSRVLRALLRAYWRAVTALLR
jgi:GT2 family glycosyltransferase